MTRAKVCNLPVITNRLTLNEIFLLSQQTHISLVFTDMAHSMTTSLSVLDSIAFHFFFLSLISLQCWMCSFFARENKKKAKIFCWFLSLLLPAFCLEQMFVWTFKEKPLWWWKVYRYTNGLFFKLFYVDNYYVSQDYPNKHKFHIFSHHFHLYSMTFGCCSFSFFFFILMCVWCGYSWFSLLFYDIKYTLIK